MPIRFPLLPLLLAAAVFPTEAEEVPWALRPLARPEVSEGTTGAIDRLVGEGLKAQGLAPSVPASRRVLIRRAFFDLTGLPPTPEEVAEFVADDRPDAYGALLDRLLASPRYGERWARHWMDVAHFAETQGHDEDAIRPNAWPYRDYLIGAFNADKPYARFVMEQVAGDVLFPGEPEATVATGFLAAGPWDGSSQMGIQDGTRDKKVAQYLDRDDMLTTVMLSFNSLTVHCARCHDHKFDPISTADYYALQAVFAGVDRADRDYDADPETGKERVRLKEALAMLTGGGLSGARIEKVEARPEYWKWIADCGGKGEMWQVLDPEDVTASGRATVMELEDHSLLYGGERPEKDTYILKAPVTGMESVTAVRLEVLADVSLPLRGPGRQDNGNLHLSEFRVSGPDGVTVPIARAEADWNQEGWGIERAIDGVPETAWGIYPKVGESHVAVFHFAEPIKPTVGGVLTFTLEQVHGGGHLIGRPRISASSSGDAGLTETLPDSVADILALAPEKWNAAQRREVASYYVKVTDERSLAALPSPSKVYSVTKDFAAAGNFKPAEVPREVHVLKRGNIDDPGEIARPGALSCVPGLKARFELPPGEGEGARRAALARWLADSKNVLTWRSIVNRVWHYHFGRGLAGRPNDFGKMGEAPTHPELLDFLAYEFRERGGSLKWLHKTIMLSETYRQDSTSREEAGGIDKGNRWLWRMSRPRLDAESIRDTVLQISGKLDLTMGGPSSRQFLESKGVHVTPNLDYLGFDPDDPANFRRSIYRFVFRTVPDPFMQALDCPDASQWTPERSASFNALGALAMENSPFLVRQCEHLAARLETERPTTEARVFRLYQLAFQRDPEGEELAQVSAYVERHGLANACRVIVNSNEFVFLE
jgi:hypothetical protein